MLLFLKFLYETLPSLFFLFWRETNKLNLAWPSLCLRPSSGVHCWLPLQTNNWIYSISIYTLSDLGDLNNLIGLLSRTIQQYSPPSEWIMCELGVFPIFLETNLLKVDKILALTFFWGKKRLGRIQYGVFQFTVAEFCAWWIVYNSRVFV